MPDLKTLRTKKALSQRDLAEKSGIAHATICRLEIGKQKPTFKTIRKLAEALGVDASDIDFK